MSYLKFMFSLIIVYLALSSWMVNSWLTLWMMMEASLLLFMGLLAIDINYSVVELMMKYFVFQALAGLLLIGCLISSLLMMSSFVDFIMVLVLMVKLGMAPFHSWLISVLGKMNWTSFFIMSTFLKLIPMLMFSYLIEMVLLSTVAGLSAMAGSLLGVGELQIQKLLGYSSLSTISWLLYSSLGGFFFFFFFWLGYLILMGLICFLFSLMSIYYLSQFKLVSFSLELKISFLFMFFSLSGVPPFLGFILKWVLIYFLVFMGSSLFGWILVFMSLFSAFYYLQLWFYILLMFSFELKWYSFNFTSLWWGVIGWIFYSTMMLVYFVV